MISQAQVPSAFTRQRLVGPATLPSAQTRLAMPSVGPHLAGSHSAAIVVAGAGGRRQLETSQRSSAAQFASVLQMPRAGLQEQGPMQASLPSQTTSSPALQLGVVQPQRPRSIGGGVGAPVAGSVVTGVTHGH